MNVALTIRPELLSLTPEQWGSILPYVWLFGGTVLAIFFSVLRRISSKWSVFLTAILALGAGIVCSFELLPQGAVLLFNGMMVADRYANFFNIIFLASAAVTLLVSFRYLDRENLQHPEYYLLILFSTIGMMLMASALDLIVIFIALEIMSLSVYVLVGFRRADRRSNEAAMKYFILGSAASAVLLYGGALLYGSTGSTNIREILGLIQKHQIIFTPVFALGTALVLLGFLFKVASVPFHMWMPDVYEGAPTPITAFMTTGLKAAAFASFVRVFISLGYGGGLSQVIQSHLHNILWAAAVLTMVLGNVVALTQTNLKRMLAYSSIAHSGYLLVGLIAGSSSEEGYAPIVLYLVAYSIMNLGAFIILSIISSREDGGLNLHDFSGLARRHPWLAFSMSIFMFSMAGVPPTAGFAAKYLLFYSAIQAHEVSLVVISVLCSAISVYYYLRVLVYMYMRDLEKNSQISPISVGAALAVGLMVVCTLELGILPSPILQAAKKAVASL